MTLRQLRLLAVGLLAFVLIGGTGTFAFLPAGAATSSALTKKGAGPFAALEVTVSKTKGLGNEVIQVTWNGAAPTVPAGGQRRNFLQIMQCWGDTSPTREQCQFGATFAPAGAGNAITSRIVKSGSAVPTDASEVTFPENWVSGSRTFVPFKPVSGDRVSGDFNSLTTYFDLQGTNEVPIARTGGDGTGKEFFEVHTAREAAGLGCGTNVGSAESPKGRPCWLVVVPRGQVEVDETVRDGNYVDPNHGKNATYQRVDSSPLAASNWANRIEFPLDFRPIGGACATGGQQVQLLGHEFVTEAITFWQPQLCAAAGEVFSFSITPDGVARNDVTRTGDSMAIVADPPSAAGTRLQYAPLAISGLGIAYFMESQVDQQGSEAVLARDGVRIENLKLTPRLVAKLLTQSYTYGALDPGKLDADNPSRLEEDEEFLEINPLFKDNDGNGVPDVNGIGTNGVARIIVPFGQADGWALVWRYIAADNDAKAFLAGTADPWGAVVNPAYRNMATDSRSEFPQLDQSCVKPGVDLGELCPPDAFPYANDMHLGVADVVRGFSGARTAWNPLALPPRYDRNGAQARGKRNLILISDAATASRYGLPMAQLQLPNRKGAFVGPNEAAMLAAVAGMTAGPVAGTLVPNPAPGNSAAYPLTVISYAVVSPNNLSAENRKAYAAFLNYAAGPGQQPGSLPPGYAPLPAAMRKQTRVAATAITVNTATPTTRATPQPTPRPTKNNNLGSGGDGGDNPAAPIPDASPNPTPDAETPVPTPDPNGVPVPAAPVVPIEDPDVTPVALVGDRAKALPALLVIGLLGALAARFSPRLWPAVRPGRADPS